MHITYSFRNTYFTKLKSFPAAHSDLPPCLAVILAIIITTAIIIINSIFNQS